tara:strand:+ start:2982 stop:3419 length:438 start_codon:yes stop_codon:yes gene_type:complete
MNSSDWKIKNRKKQYTYWLYKAKNIKIQLSNIITTYDKLKKSSNDNKGGGKSYWDKLQDSLKDEGLNQEKYSNIIAYKDFFRKGKYRLIDGNHRIWLFKKNHKDTPNMIMEIKVINRLYIILLWLSVPLAFPFIIIHALIHSKGK